MSKREVPPNFMKNMLAGKPTSDVQTTDTVPTNDRQATHSVRTNDRQGPTPRRQVRIVDELWERMSAEAKRREISVSALIRQAVVEYLR